MIPLNKILEGNKLIQEFMEVDAFEYDSWKVNQLTEGLYHSSWDWLMPIWKKIVDIGDSLMSQERNLYFKEITHGLYICDIQVVWSGIVEFIEWYNQSKQI